jgi:hypothetical protein
MVEATKVCHILLNTSLFVGITSVFLSVQYDTSPAPNTESVFAYNIQIDKCVSVCRIPHPHPYTPITLIFKGKNKMDLEIIGLRRAAHTSPPDWVWH